MLTPHELTAHLLRRGLLPSDSIVDGELTIKDRSRRNQNFEVVSSLGPAYFVKQARTESMATLRHEADVYRFLAGGDLARHLPSVSHFDRRRGLLVLRLLSGARSISDIIERKRRLGVGTAAMLGRAVAAIHRSAVHSFPGDVRSPWILTLSAPRADLLRTISGANVQLIRIVQESRSTCRVLNQLRDGWRSSSLIHHDLRLGNCLVAGGTLKIVDWELAGAGDPAWDVGCVLADFVSLWIFSMPIGSTLPTSRVTAAARLPLERLQMPMAAFWNSYEAASNRGPGDFLVQAARFAGARLIQVAYERMQASARLTTHAVALLQLGANTLARPEEAIEQLFIGHG